MSLLSFIRSFNVIAEGHKTTGGLVLHKYPSLDEPDNLKFAVFSDNRFYTIEHYLFFKK